MNAATEPAVAPAANGGGRAKPSIAIIERLPAYRRGLAVGFAERGFDVRELPELAEAVDLNAIALTIDAEVEWSLLGELKSLYPDTVLVALTDDGAAATWRRALRAGANAVVPREAPIDEIVAAVEAALRGATVLPTAMVRALLEEAPDAEDAFVINDCEIGWLREMAAGVTVAKLALGARYSERQMHRRIADVYRRIGAANRQQALVAAARRGILD